MQFSVLRYGVNAVNYYCYYCEDRGFGATMTITSPCYVNTLSQLTLQILFHVIFKAILQGGYKA